MSLLVIERAFTDLINQRGAHRLCKVSCNAMQQTRWRHRHHGTVSYNTKIKLLQRSGHRFEGGLYTRAELLDVLAYAIKSSKHARGLGAAYLLEKYELGGKMGVL